MARNNVLLSFVEMFEQVNLSWFKKAFVAITLPITDLRLSGLLDGSNNRSDVLFLASTRSKRKPLELRYYLGDSGAILRRKGCIITI